MERKCGNCKRRFYESYFSIETCIGYEYAETDEAEIKEALSCAKYEEDDGADRNYCPSSTARDYSPSNPWDAPGMSVRDFI